MGLPAMAVNSVLETNLYITPTNAPTWQAKSVVKLARKAKAPPKSFKPSTYVLNSVWLKSVVSNVSGDGFISGTDGIVLAQLDKKPVTILPKLFQYAFFAHHKRISKILVEEIFELFTDKNDMYNKLSTMAMDTLNTLFEDNTSKNAGCLISNQTALPLSLAVL